MPVFSVVHPTAALSVVLLPDGHAFALAGGWRATDATALGEHGHDVFGPFADLDEARHEIEAYVAQWIAVLVPPTADRGHWEDAQLYAAERRHGQRGIFVSVSQDALDALAVLRTFEVIDGADGGAFDYLDHHEHAAAEFYESIEDAFMAGDLRLLLWDPDEAATECECSPETMRPSDRANPPQGQGDEG